MREAIPWNFTEFVDNRACVDLLECTPGLFSLLNEVRIITCFVWTEISLVLSHHYSGSCK